MADAEPQEEPPRVRSRQRGVTRRHVLRLVHPDVEDSGGDDGLLGGVEERPSVTEDVATGATGNPQRGVPERLELGGGVARFDAVAVAEGATPDPGTGQFHRCLPDNCAYAPGALHTGERTMDELRDRVAVITGGASGIGRATALALAREGTVPVIADIEMQRAEAVAQEAPRPGCRSGRGALRRHE